MARLMVGYGDTKARRGRRGPRVGQDQPVGPKHAFLEGDEHAICGRRIVVPTEQLWPGSALSERCDTCGSGATAPPTPR